MRNIKNYASIRNIVLYSLLILFVMGIYLVINTFDKSYALDDTYYRYVERVESGYYVRYLKAGETERTGKYDTGYMKISVNGNTDNLLNVFCAFRGKPLSTDVDYYRYNFDQFYSSRSAEWRRKLAGIVMLYSPESSITTLKSYLQTNYPDKYQSAGLDELKSSEAIVAFQTAEMM